METRKVGKKFLVYFSYFEWVKAGNKMPPLPEYCNLEDVRDFIIRKVPQDKKDFFEEFGWIVRLAGSVGGFKPPKI